ncbi:MAG: thiamine pyrophosphate-binding protein [bacterium]|nr:thiamine pyrophosphate-binding protein [bacterium]
MKIAERMLLSGNEAVALAALRSGVNLGVGYPGTPSTEILETLGEIGGRAQWSPNEKVALEVALGVSFSGGRALATMKHVGLNVAADPLFTAAYTGVDSALVIVSADDPGMASSQNEQDNRRYAEAAGLPMIEPADSQEAYDFFMQAVKLSERWNIPVLFRLTTRICHSKTVVQCDGATMPAATPAFRRDIKGRVMIPGYARLAHRRLRSKLAAISEWNEEGELSETVLHDRSLGIITSGVCAMHVREAAPRASMLKLGLTYPLPMRQIAEFIQNVERCVVVEEGDPFLVDAIRAAGLKIDSKSESFRFGELNSERVRLILQGEEEPDAVPRKPGKPPQLCPGCPHRNVFQILHDMDCIVSGDIGCYTLGVMPPFEAMDTCVCMGASLGVGLGLRHSLPADEARRVVSVIGDSTFIHSGITGLVEMVYNPPATGHVVLILDNGTTAMTGLQEHPATGRTLDHHRTRQVSMERLAESIGLDSVEVVEPGAMEPALTAALARNDLSLIIVRRPCVLAAGKIRQYEKAIAEDAACASCAE